MSYDPKAVANHFLERGWAAKVPIDPMKLQKLVYFAHGWHLALSDRPLINHPVEAWCFGPMVRSLHVEFREFGISPITVHATEFWWEGGGPTRWYEPRVEGGEDDDYARRVMDRIWDVYAVPFSGVQLSNMTHDDGTPWTAIYERFGRKIPPGTTIPDEAIGEHFKAQLGVQSEAG